MSEKPMYLSVPGRLGISSNRSSAVLTIDDGTFEKRLGWTAAALFFGLFVLGGAFIRLDAAAVASGVIAVSGSRQVIQHKDGGNISLVNVREGQHVRKGDLLIRLAGDDTLASADSLEAQVVDLEAQRARLLAERLGGNIQTPPEFAGLRGKAADEAKRALLMQSSELATRRRELRDKSQVLNEQTGQMGSRIKGIQDQIAANETQRDLLNDQLVGLRSLAAKGFASLNKVRELERTEASLQGDTAQLRAAIAETRGQMGEGANQKLSLQSERQQQVSEDLRAAEFNLDDLIPKLAAAKQALDKTVVRAPVDGQVVGLQVFSPGAIVTPGQKLLEIVPSKAELVVEVKVAPSDADDLYVGQAADVRVTALHDRSLPILRGNITRLSADSFEDPRTGSMYYTAQVTVPDKEYRNLEQLTGGRETIKPGLPVEVMIALRKRTLLQYLLEPIDQIVWSSMREH